MEGQQTNQPAHPPSAGGQANTGMAIVAYIIFFIPLLTDAKKDAFVRFHVRQGLAIFAMGVILWVIRMIMPWYWLWNLSWLLSLLSLAILVFAILGIVNAANGKQEKLPIVGGFGEALAKMFKI
ncbi:MAG: hypothetical protein PHD72_01990 [Patescibacteria group bacterium]|nr:hypothetical protein [Patescibacteria group bacterium]